MLFRMVRAESRTLTKDRPDGDPMESWGVGWTLCTILLGQAPAGEGSLVSVSN